MSTETAATAASEPTTAATAATIEPGTTPVADPATPETSTAAGQAGSLIARFMHATFQGSSQPAANVGPGIYWVIWGPEKGECQIAAVRADSCQEAALLLRKDMPAIDGERIHVQVIEDGADHYELV
jgi:hypothetical protein